jgi:glycosyltransferase involved in cell wall biosynthesis
VITVGDGVAEALREAYGWRHVVVVRNTFPIAEPPPPVAAPSAAVYAGRLGPQRDLETVAAASRTIDLPTRLIGPADETWLAGFDPGAAAVEPALPVEAVDRVLSAAGLALVTLADGWANHRLAMPNKLFHAVAAGVPVVATDIGELARLVRAHGLGELYPAGDPAGLAGAVRRAQNRYQELTAAVRRAAPRLSWDADASVLRGVYERLAVGLGTRREGRYPDPTPGGSSQP